jgi:hypothetical protein
MIKMEAIKTKRAKREQKEMIEEGERRETLRRIKSKANKAREETAILEAELECFEAQEEAKRAAQNLQEKKRLARMSRNGKRQKK